MTDTVKAAVITGVIGGFFGILTFVGGIYQEDIRNYFNSGATSQNQFLVGKWIGTWNIVSPEKKSLPPDTITITTVRGTLVKGVGSTPELGDYDLDGRATDLAVSFSYTGKSDQQRQLPGAIVLKKVNPNLMTGAWTQYMLSGDVVSGTAEWRRAPK
jgi:hypothetical protein